LWAGTKAFFGSLKTTAYDIGNHLTFGKILDSERYNDQVNAQGERLYNVAKNLGYSDNSIANGYGLAQVLAGEIVGTNNLAESVTGYDLGRNIMLDGSERAEKAASGVAQVAGTLATGLSFAKSMLRNCFLAGTLVSKYSDDGINNRELIPIEQIKFGDKVWSFNCSINRWEPRPVLETFRTQYEGDIVSINFGEDMINSTGEHPFWVLQGEDLENRPLCDCLPVCDQKITPDGRWVYARDLRIDDIVRSHSLGTQKILALELSQTKTLVYNFLVDDLHNYAVGENEVLVHNINSPGRSEHAKSRATQGRPVGSAFKDASQANVSNVYIQADGRYVVAGPKGRFHVFEMTGEIVTSMKRSAQNVQTMLKDGRITRVTLEQFEEFKKLFN
jgi:hypothetical protein